MWLFQRTPPKCKEIYVALQRRGKSSRLDGWFISEHLLKEIESYKILQGLHSYHSILKIEIGNNKIPWGKGFWKFNNSLIHDTDFVHKIKKILKIVK